MTDHHDELASAYLDGQVSPEEAARVEGDPRLMAEVEALAGVVERLQTEEAPVEPGARQRHLSAALAAFDEVKVDDGGAAPTNVIRFGAAADRPGPGDPPTQVYPRAEDVARRAARVASAPAVQDQLGARRSQARRRPGLPNWLSAAAALLIVAGGIGWFMSRQDGSDDTATATFSTGSAEEEGAVADGAALSEVAESSEASLGSPAGGDTAKTGAESAGGGALDAQQAVPGAEATAAAAATTAASDGAPATTTSRGVTTAPSSAAPATTEASGGLSFAAAPSGDEVQDRLSALGQSPQPAGGSTCGVSVPAPTGTSLTGFVPITVGGVAGEALFYRPGSASGATTVVVVRTPSCQAFS